MAGKREGGLLFKKGFMSWYKKGLRFHCTGCGQCCTGQPGYVWVTDDEVEKIASYLNLSKEECIRRYTRSIFGRLSLIEDKVNFDCIFLKEKKCMIYSMRPKQCRTFPWWREVLASSDRWKEAARYCEGINHPNAPRIPFEQIEEEKEK